MDPADPELVDAAKNWLAMDGLWFLAVEGAFGLEKAMELDRKIWTDFSRIEAERIKKRLSLPEHGGLDALDSALRHRLHSLLNPFRIERPSGDTLCYFMLTCRTQDARERRDLPLFPCREVGLVEYSVFARTIDPRFETACIACPPDAGDREFSCGWRFTLPQR
ncbi:MAG: hypothetical protein GKC05_06385 [Methanomicrobiales archaeon]|nr:hypothetical protein [Methanomicrobiales archaeon]